MLPNDYLRRMKQDLSEVEAQVEAEMRREPDSEQLDESQSDDASSP
jgi:uncharacterized OsmC-like protein